MPKRLRAVLGEIKHPVAQRADTGKQVLRLFDRDDIGQSLDLGRLDQTRYDPGLVQAGLSSRNIAQSNPRQNHQGAEVQNNSCRGSLGFLHVAASPNLSFDADCCGAGHVKRQSA